MAEQVGVLAQAPDKCLITGLDKCTSYRINGDVVYLGASKYYAYTLPEYDKEEKVFYQTRYDMDDELAETDNGILCTLADLIDNNHANLQQIKEYYNIDDLDFVHLYKFADALYIAATCKEDAIHHYNSLQGFELDETVDEEAVYAVDNAELFKKINGDIANTSEIIERYWQGQPFVFINKSRSK